MTIKSKNNIFIEFSEEDNNLKIKWDFIDETWIVYENVCNNN